MKPKVFARFNATMYIPGIGSIGSSISNIDDLRDFVNKSNNDIPYKVTILRENCVVNMDKKAEDVSPFDKNKYIDGHPVIASEIDTKMELILPKLMYPNDVKEYLVKKHSGVRFDTQKYDPKTPLFFNIIEETCVGMRISETCAPANIKWHDVHCEPLSTKDIVVDKNCNQIWPTATKQPPVGLIELLSKKTEKVY